MRGRNGTMFISFTQPFKFLPDFLYVRYIHKISLVYCLLVHFRFSYNTTNKNTKKITYSVKNFKLLCKKYVSLNINYVYI